MRTTIRLDDELLAAAKQYALTHGKTFTAVVEDALREILTSRGKLKKRTPVKLITISGHGVCTGVDIDDSASLLDVMER